VANPIWYSRNINEWRIGPFGANDPVPSVQQMLWFVAPFPCACFNRGGVDAAVRSTGTMPGILGIFTETDTDRIGVDDELEDARRMVLRRDHLDTDSVQGFWIGGHVGEE